jgi:hypothetical protein
MDTWIRCGVESVFEGRLTDTIFLISAVGDEIVVQELSQERRNVTARVPIENPEAVPELHKSVVDLVIANVSKQSI